MFQYKKNNDNDDNNISRENIIKELSKNYNYVEHIADGRIVLEHRRVKFVEIKDTKEDREKYILIMQHYIEYIKEHYYKNASAIDIEFCKLFDEEILKYKKLPMFFVYNSNNVLLGICGFCKSIIVNIDNKDICFGELSIRLAEKSVHKISYGYGAICYLILSLYAIKTSTRYYFKSFVFLRELIFRSVNEFAYIKYVKRCICRPVFLDKTCDCDVFLDYKVNNCKLNLGFLERI